MASADRIPVSMEMASEELLEQFHTPADIGRRRQRQEYDDGATESTNDRPRTRANDRDSLAREDQLPKYLPVGQEIRRFDVCKDEVDPWLQNITNVVRTSGYSSGVHYRLIVAYLSRDLQCLVTSTEIYPTIPNVKDLEAWLRRHLRPLHYELTLQQKLFELRQTPDENIMGFAHRMYNLYQQLHPMSKFSDILPHLWGQMPRALALAAEAHRDSKDVAELMLKLLRVEQGLAEINHNRDNLAFAARTNSVPPQKAVSNSAQKPARTLKCWNCDGSHRLTDCPSPVNQSRIDDAKSRSFPFKKSNKNISKSAVLQSSLSANSATVANSTDSTIFAFSGRISAQQLLEPPLTDLIQSADIKALRKQPELSYAVTSETTHLRALLDSGCSCVVIGNSVLPSWAEIRPQTDAVTLRVPGGTNPVVGSANFTIVLTDDTGAQCRISCSSALVVKGDTPLILPLQKFNGAVFSVSVTKQPNDSHAILGRHRIPAQMNDGVWQLPYIWEKPISMAATTTSLPDWVKNCPELIPLNAEERMRRVHRLLGHPGRGVVQATLDLTSAETKPLRNCETCIMARGHSLKVTSVTDDCTEFNERVAIDLMCMTRSGPYVLLIADYCTNIIGVGFQIRRDAESTLANYIKAWECPYGIPKAVRLDNDTAYKSLEGHLVSQRVHVQYTAPGSSWSNGKAERAIRLLQERARAFYQELPSPTEDAQMLWNIISHAALVLNMTPRLKKDGKWSTPLELAGKRGTMLRGFLPGEVILVHGRDETSSPASKFKARWRRATFLSQRNSGKVIIKEAGTIRAVHPSRLRAFESGAVDAEVHSEELADPEDFEDEASNADMDDVTLTVEVDDEDEEVMDIHGDVRANSTCMHPDHYRDPWLFAKPGRCQRGFCRFHCMITHRKESLTSTPVGCRQHLYNEAATMRYLDKIAEKRPLAAAAAIYQHRVRFEDVDEDTESVGMLAMAAKKHTKNPRLQKTNPEVLAAMKKEVAGWREKQVTTPLSTEEAQAKLACGTAIKVGTHWVITEKSDGAIKARLVLLGNTDTREETDDNVPVADAATIRLMLSLTRAICPKMESPPMILADIKQAYLNAVMDEGEVDVIINSIDDKPGFEVLRKAAYGMSDSGRKWYQALSAAFAKQKIHPLTLDPSIFSDGETFITTYVDDLLAIGPRCEEVLNALGYDYGKLVKLRDGEEQVFAGIRIKRHEKEFILSTDYKLDNITSTWTRRTNTALPLSLTPSDDKDITNPKVITAYRSILGSLAWIASTSRPDLSYAVTFLARRQHQPTERALQLANRLVSYAQQHKATVVLPYADHPTAINIWADASWGAEHDGYRSTLGFAIFVEYDNGQAPVMWKSKLSPRTHRSSMSAELQSAVYAIGYGLHYAQLIKEMLHIDIPVKMHLDARCVLDAVVQKKRSLPRDRTLTMNIQYLRELDGDGVQFIKVQTDAHLADELTKATTTTRLATMVPKCLTTQWQQEGGGMLKSSPVICSSSPNPL